MSTPLNAVLLGYGYAGKTFHAPLIAACRDLRLYGIVSSKPEQLATDWPLARAGQRWSRLCRIPQSI
jgi:predicted dehydrogenase